MGEAAGTDELLSVRREALARARRRKPVWLDRRLIAASLVAAVAAPAGGMWWLRHRGGQDELIQTALGEQRTPTLSDGSRVTLDALTVMRVRYTTSLRSIDLVAGRGYFEVAHDTSRPLRVRAGPRTVTAVGTAFSVRREPRETTIVLAEGKVAVSNHESAAILAMLRPGQSMVLVDGPRGRAQDGRPRPGPGLAQGAGGVRRRRPGGCGGRDEPLFDPAGGGGRSASGGPAGQRARSMWATAAPSWRPCRPISRCGSRTPPAIRN